jgi:hypothetical protein
VKELVEKINESKKVVNSLRATDCTELDYFNQEAVLNNILEAKL